MNNKPNAKARQVRADILKPPYACQSGRPSGSLSCVKILLTLYENVMKYDPKNPCTEDRDRLVTNRNHICPTPYAVLVDEGFFPREDLQYLRQANSHPQGYPDMTKTSGVDCSTNSLGQEISTASDMVTAAKYKKVDYKVYALVGGGEVQEGLVREAAMSTVHYRFDNFTVLLDFNHPQIDGSNNQVMNVGDPIEELRAFGSEYLEVDGYDIDATTEAIEKPVVGKLKFICYHTYKGHGASSMEDNYGWHGEPTPRDDFVTAMKELGVEIGG